MSKPINLYIAPQVTLEEQNWSLLFQTPTVLFSNIHKTKTHTPDGLGYTSCPAVRSKLKKILTFPNSLSCKYEYDFSGDEPTLTNLTDAYFKIHDVRDNGFHRKPSVFFGYSFIMFADEPLEINFTPPYFNKPEYTKYGTVVPGTYDVGKWFRPFNMEVQLWENKGVFEFKEGEPLFYAELMTDRRVNVHRFAYTDSLEKLSKACVESTATFGLGQTLLSRYNRFRAAGLRERVLTEIRQNLIEENFLTL